MAVSNITVKGLTPILSILGNYQRFTFDDPFSSFQKDALFVPTLGNPSQTNDEHRNSNLSGFRWYHKTLSTDTIGSFTLQSFLNASPTGTDLMRVNQNNTIDFLVPTSLSGFAITADLDVDGFKIINLGTPTLATDGATKAYVDSVAGGTITLTGAVTGSGTGTIATTLTPITTALITNFNSAVLAFRLDQFALPTANLNVNGEKITNLATPTVGTDAANKNYVDGKTWTTSVITDFVAAVTAFRLDQFAAPTSAVSMGSQKITNLAKPTLGSDAVNKDYADALVGGAITLTGAVTGTGTGTIATTLTNITTSQISNFNAAVTAFRLDQFAEPTSTVKLNSQVISNLASPFLDTDAANKSYVDSVGSNASSAANAFTEIYQRSASCYFPGNNSTTNILIANVSQKIAGSTNMSLNGFNFDGINNRLRYAGPQTLFFTVYGSAQVSSTVAGTTNINLELVKNGTTGLLTPFMAGRVQGTNEPQIFSIDVAPFHLSTNDFVELYIRASNNTTVTVSNMIWTVRVY